MAPMKAAPKKAIGKALKKVVLAPVKNATIPAPVLKRPAAPVPAPVLKNAAVGISVLKRPAAAATSAEAEETPVPTLKRRPAASESREEVSDAVVASPRKVLKGAVATLPIREAARGASKAEAAATKEAAQRAAQDAKEVERQSAQAAKEAARQAAQDANAAAREAAQAAKEAARQAAQEANEVARQAAQKAKEDARQVAQQAKEDAAAQRASAKAAEKEAQQQQKMSDAAKLAATKAALEAMRKPNPSQQPIAAAKVTSTGNTRATSSKAVVASPPSTEEIVSQLKQQIGSSVRICILGGTSFQCPDTEELAKAIAAELVSRFGKQVAFITGGMHGVQHSFAAHCGDGSTVWNLLPVGQASGYSFGKDIHAGKDLEERKKLFGQLGDIYITFEGGPGVAQEADAAWSRGAKIVPLIRTGGASCGMFDFPLAALDKPALAIAEDWALLSDKMASVASSAAGAVNTVAKFVSELAGPNDVAQEDAPSLAGNAISTSQPSQVEARSPLPSAALEARSPVPSATLDMGDVD